MKTIEFIPNFQRVLILPDIVEGKTKSGIIIPETAQKRAKRGIVIAVGEGDKDTPMKYSRGDRVIYGEYAGTEIDLDLINHKEHEYLIMQQIDIMGRIIEYDTGTDPRPQFEPDKIKEDGTLN